MIGWLKKLFGDELSAALCAENDQLRDRWQRVDKALPGLCLAESALRAACEDGDAPLRLRAQVALGHLSSALDSINGRFRRSRLGSRRAWSRTILQEIIEGQEHIDRLRQETMGEVLRRIQEDKLPPALAAAEMLSEMGP